MTVRVLWPEVVKGAQPGDRLYDDRGTEWTALGSAHAMTKLYFDEEEKGIIEAHFTPEGHLCKGSVWFEGVAPAGRPSWKVESRDPLTLSPSIACPRCPSHGHIQEGRWV